MTRQWRRSHGWGLALLASLALWAVLLLPLAGCAIGPIEPVETPPSAYQHGTIVPVQFTDAATVGLACAKRGALPIARACADTDMITLPNPCQTPTGGWYAKMLCHELAHANGWSARHSK